MIMRTILLAIFLLCTSHGMHASAQITGDSESSLPPHSLFGWAVSVHGEFAAISAPGERSGEMSSCGAVYIYRMHHGEWKYMQRIIPSDPTMMKHFGASIKLQDFRLLVGAPGDNSKTGAVYVYLYDGESWVAEQKLAPSKSVMFQGFGTHVEMGHGIAALSSSSRLPDGKFQILRIYSYGEKFGYGQLPKFIRDLYRLGTNQSGYCKCRSIADQFR